jgi:hypothetical protein
MIFHTAEQMTDAAFEARNITLTQAIMWLAVARHSTSTAANAAQGAATMMAISQHKDDRDEAIHRAIAAEVAIAKADPSEVPAAAYNAMVELFDHVSIMIDCARDGDHDALGGAESMINTIAVKLIDFIACAQYARRDFEQNDPRILAPHEGCA